MSGKLIIVGTPIGNKEDISIRAIKTLASAKIILCEDTRVTSKLLNLIDEWALLLGLTENKPRLIRFDETYERMTIVEVVGWLKNGEDVVLVSDAGMPLVSDPGYNLVKQLRDLGYEIQVVPGASALTAAMSLAGIPVNHSLFVGFLPKKEGKRMKILHSWFDLITEELKPTLVIYESPFRLHHLIDELEELSESLEVVLCGELTKMHEKVIRGSISEIRGQLDDKPKGEWVVLVKVA